MHKIAMADDHTLLRNGLANLIDTFDGFKVSLQVSNGKELMDKLDAKNLPDIVLLDINMPIMDGYQTAESLSKTYPQIKILALSMMDTESAIIRMIRNGARGYVLKDAEPKELKTALNDLMTKGFYYNDLVTGKLIFTINKFGDDANGLKALANLSEKEIQFLKHTCSDAAYKEIADRMGISVRTVDGYRENLFEKLNVKSRIGLAMFAIKQGLVEL